MKALVYFIILAGFFALLTSVIPYLPARGSLDAPLHRDVSPIGTPVAGNYYIREAYNDTHTDNMVTVVLGDYRAFDTLGETLVVFTAGVACLLILGRRKAP